MINQAIKDRLDSDNRGDILSFTDADKVNSKYQEALEMLVGNSLINGYPDGTVNP